MEPPGGVPPDRDRQLVLRNQSAALVPVVVSAPATGPGAAPNPQPPAQAQLSLVPSKPTSLSLQPHAVLQAMQQLSPSAGGNNNASSTAATATSSSSGNANSGSSPALASTATAISATTQAATAFSGSSVGHHHLQHHHQHTHPHAPQQSQSQPQPQHQRQQPHPASVPSAAPQSHHHGSISVSGSGGGLLGSSGGSGNQQQAIEKLSRPMAFDKMEMLVREMQDQEHGVPVRQQKMFLTSIPYAFMGYDLIEWLMDRLQIEESEALNIANQLCLHGYFFPVNDSKTLTVKDDSSLYRFQTPYYWPWQHKAPDNVEYAIYLAKRSLRNKQRHALEDYEAEALASLHKNLKGKWDFISMQAEEQVRLAKERKKGDKIVGDSQERAYWRVHRPPPGQFTPLEPCPVPSRDRQGLKPNKKKTVDDMQRDVDYLGKSLNRTRMKMSQACESLVCYSETFSEYDFFLQPALPSNPWVTEDIAFWQLNNTFVDIPTEKRVKRWAISIEELVSDPTGLQEFTGFLEKEYSHENIRFWIAVNRLRRSAHSQVARKVNEIYEEFLKPGAPCEINIDGKTMESVLKGLKNPSRFTFDSASEHIYMLLLKKDCYPRFIRSEHYKRLLDTGIQPSYKKRFFNFGGVSGAKKKMTAALSSQPNLGDAAKGPSGTSAGSSMMQAPPQGNLARRRGSDRSLTGSAHELAVIGVNKDAGSKVPHSHSQSNLSEIPFSSDSIYRGDMPQRHMAIMDIGIYAAYGNRESSLQTLPETPKTKTTVLDATESTSSSTALAAAASSAVCPWDDPAESVPPPPAAQVKLSVCPWELDSATETPAAAPAGGAGASKILSSTGQPMRLNSTSSDNSDVNDRMQRNLGIRHQNTVDSGEAGIKRLIPNIPEQRRASVSFTPSPTPDFQLGGTPTTTSSPTVAPSSSTPLQARSAVYGSGQGIAKDPPSGSDVDAELEEELNKISLGESSTSEPPLLVVPTPEQTPPPITKITPPPGESENQADQLVDSTEIPGSSCSIQGNQLGEATATVTTVKEVQIELIEQGSGVQTEPGSPPTIKVLVPEATTPVSAETASAEPGEDLAKMATTTNTTTITTEDQAVRADDAERDAEIEQTVLDELSPTTDEYQEGLQFGDAKDAVEDFDSIDIGYIPPAPTPAPSMAPLAELDVDTVDDEPCEPAAPPPPSHSAPPSSSSRELVMASGSVTATPTSSNEEARKRRKKRNSEGKKLSSQDEKDKDARERAGGSSMEAADHNAVCPWEDENVSTNDGTFVKTYATLGYL
ncbi:uncharacterized protein LOC6614910 isoform X1 [Drosophila sechellia]|uniref:uncharacterized protein LOC6614910 isoform X1 n=1 Tax=Drosophila sechellia TaxID=7238 RepID=UPI0013DDFCD5|nr:uncharacterized protein LOC6614910 isoform X1 [Drosophila sechellia]XP_032580532.1 uncharacterized protein LOC6614910 isoform X1 [Drosophila sechellia]